MKSLLTLLPILLPIIYAWAEGQEKFIMEKGVPLDDSQLNDARRAGVLHPDRIRVLKVADLPHPESDEVMFAAQQVGLFGARTVGVSLNYGITIKQEYWEERYALVHEFVHVAQYERLQGLRPFLREYLRQCIEPGYPFGQLEQEATHVARDLCKGSQQLPRT